MIKSGVSKDYDGNAHDWHYASPETRSAYTSTGFYFESFAREHAANALGTIPDRLLLIGRNINEHNVDIEEVYI